MNGTFLVQWSPKNVCISLNCWLLSSYEHLFTNEVRTLKCTCELHCEVHAQFSNLETQLASSQRTWDTRVEKWLEIDNKKGFSKVAVTVSNPTLLIFQYMLLSFKCIMCTSANPRENLCTGYTSIRVDCASIWRVLRRA